MAPFSLVRFPNCHECPEASGLGNLIIFSLPLSANEMYSRLLFSNCLCSQFYKWVNIISFCHAWPPEQPFRCFYCCFFTCTTYRAPTSSPQTLLPCSNLISAPNSNRMKFTCDRCVCSCLRSNLEMNAYNQIER